MILRVHPKKRPHLFGAAGVTIYFCFGKGRLQREQTSKSSEWEYCAQSRPRSVHQWVGSTLSLQARTVNYANVSFTGLSWLINLGVDKDRTER